MRKFSVILLVILFSLVLFGCSSNPQPQSSGTQEYYAQEKMQQESISKIGFPAVKNFREKRIMRDILELRDQTGYVTYAYLQNITTGKLVYLGQGIGYPIPYSTQYTNPMKYAGVPQADPNGLYSPAAAEGTWYMMKDPNSDEVKPIYCEPRIVVSPFKLH